MMIRHLCIAAILMPLVFSASDSSGQTLTETLGREDAGTLVLEARERGDIVRGAILFHQGNINCAGCHNQTASTARVGPDLSRLGERQVDDQVTDASLIESILHPSKTISKGYETRSVLTWDGRVLSGVLIHEDSNRVVLSNATEVGKRITIDREDIDQIRTSPVSTMPDGLADALKNRQQFLDLLRYVLDIKQRGPSADHSAATAERRQLSDALRGRVLISQLNCIACHEAGPPMPAIDALAAKQAPDLWWSAARLNPNHLAEFIANPRVIKPGTTMPHVLGQLDAEDRKTAAESIVHYLTSRTVTPNQSDVSKSEDNLRPDGMAAERGFELFHSVGCVACHSPRNTVALETEESTADQAPSIPLGDLTPKYPLESLVDFLENPHRVRPSGRMPNMQLSHREAMDLAAYLLQNADPIAASISTWTIDLELAEQGKRLFNESGCVRCHEQGHSEGPADPPSRSTRYTSLDELDLQMGCLSDEPGTWPDFSLTAEQKRQVRSALDSKNEPLSENDQIDLHLVAFRCVACHSRGDLGGVSEHRRGHFQTTNLNLGEQGRIPPTLTGVGAKLNPDWMRDVMVNRRSIRPYMKTRMPQYGEQNIADLIDRMQSTDSLPDEIPPAPNAEVESEKEAREYGHMLAGTKGLNCAACHTFQYQSADTMPAVDLTEMAERLKKDWFHQYMLRPQRFSPDTVMPSFWPGGKAIRPDLEGTPEDQIEAIWRYLLDGRQAQAPAGVIREPLEIVVTNEARMLRRRYPGMASKRGIGVGYPGEVNLAFDAEQMRLAMIWKGKFVDPSGVWYGQGHGNVRPMGRPVEFPMGPELNDSSNPTIMDDETRPPGHQFKGYSLDEQRRPVFSYEFGSIQVEDSFTQFADPRDGVVQLRREINLASREAHRQLRFRIDADEDITSVSEVEFKVAKRLVVRVISDHSAKITRDSEGMTLSVPLVLEAGMPQRLVLEYAWE